MVENSKHVRVDNWGVFFLQRLQMFFNKTDYCDLTLQFDGNVQLKVHRLVMNACTEYFQVLEQTCDVVDDNIILMPPYLQADVILPIVNFMYTGTLEYHPTIYERLVHTAELMNIPILIKLLEAHKAAPPAIAQPQKRAGAPHKPPKKILNSTLTKRATGNTLPNTLPGRKLPVWKRKTAPVARSTIVPRDRPVTVPSVDNMGCGASSGVGTLVSSYKSQADPTCHVDNTPKPTRFEWPEGENDKMKTETYMESSAFDNLTSYSSTPLIKGADAEKIPIYEDIRYSTVSPTQPIARKRPTGQSPYTRRINQVAIQHRPMDDDDDVSRDDDEDVDDPDYHPDYVLPTSFHAGGKRTATSSGGTGTKRVRFNEKENIVVKKERAAVSAEIDHSKLIAELLKKYPNLAKTSKNIKLKIMTKPASASSDKSASSSRATSRQMAPPTKVRKVMATSRKAPIINSTPNFTKKQLKLSAVVKKTDNEGPWVCDRCENPPDPYHLYYLYRKHMTDVHQEQFSPLMCKYCGKRTGSERALTFHMHTVHGASLNNIIGAPFPQCDRCPFAALTNHRLVRHKATHQRSHVQCPQCKVGFSGLHALNTHQQITNHISPDCAAASATGMTSYDCQYCTRHWQNSATLFVHLRTAHREDARKDGIVSIDEDPEEEEEEEEAEEEEEVDEEEVEEEQEIEVEEMEQQEGMVLEEHEISGTSMVKQVKILTDVKVSSGQNDNTVQMQIGNSGIATTLGLVDIVVLDENQQYILQSSNGDLEQSEFILPQITGSFVHQGQQVITTSTGEVHQVITTSQNPQQNQQRSSTINEQNQSSESPTIVATQSGVSTTDELVMVLTDHDYNDETNDNSGQAGPDQGNSNIVVLYSHPVQAGDGSSEGRVPCENGASLLVQTAEGQVLEIRNGPPDLVDHSSQQESIEMIQREIDNTQQIVIQHSEVDGEHIQDDQEEQSEVVESKTEQEQYQDGDQEEQQVMLVVAEDDETEQEQEIESTDDNYQDEAISRHLPDESVDVQDGVPVEVDRQEQDGGNGEDVCGTQEQPSEETEAMDVDEAQEDSANTSNDKNDCAEATALPHSPIHHHKLPVTELPTINEETNEAKQHEIEEIASEVANCSSKDGIEEAMEVDSSDKTMEESKDGGATDHLDNGRGIEEQLHDEYDTSNVANSTLEDDNIQTEHVNDENDVSHEKIEEVNNIVEQSINEEEEADNSKNITNIPEDEVDSNVNVLSQVNKDKISEENVEETMASIIEKQPTSKVDAPTTEAPKSVTQNSTIALLDEWEDTEDSSSQDKNCQTAVKTTTDTVNKLINDDWDDDD